MVGIVGSSALRKICRWRSARADATYGGQRIKRLLRVATCAHASWGIDTGVHGSVPRNYAKKRIGLIRLCARRVYRVRVVMDAGMGVQRRYLGEGDVGRRYPVYRLNYDQRTPNFN
jgi:hypothetical protein